MDEKLVLWGAAAPPSIASPELNTRGGEHPVSPFARNAAAATRASPVSPFARQNSEQQQQRPASPFAKPGGEAPVSAFARPPLANSAPGPALFGSHQQLNAEFAPALSSPLTNPSSQPRTQQGIIVANENVPQPSRPATVSVAVMPQPQASRFTTGGDAVDAPPLHAAPLLPAQRAGPRPGSPLARNVVQRAFPVAQKQAEQPRQPQPHQQAVESQRLQGEPTSVVKTLQTTSGHAEQRSAHVQHSENQAIASMPQRPPALSEPTAHALPPAPELVLHPAPILDPRRISVNRPPTAESVTSSLSDSARTENDSSIPPAPMLQLQPAPILDLRRVSVGARKEESPIVMAAEGGLPPAPILPPAPVLAPAPILPPAPIPSDAAPSPPTANKARGSHHHYPPLPQHLSVPQHAPSSQQASQQVGQDPPSPASPPHSPYSPSPTTPTSPFDTAKRAFGSTSSPVPSPTFPFPRTNPTIRASLSPSGRSTLPRSPFAPPEPPPKDWPLSSSSPSSEPAAGGGGGGASFLRIGIPSHSSENNMPVKSPFARTPEDDAAPRSPFNVSSPISGGGMMFGPGGGAPYSPLSGVMPFGRRVVEEVVQSPIEAAKIFFAEKKESALGLPPPGIVVGGSGATGAGSVGAGVQWAGSLRANVAPGASATVQRGLPGSKPTNAAQSIIESRRRTASSASGTVPPSALRTNLIINPAASLSRPSPTQLTTSPNQALPSPSPSQSQQQLPPSASSSSSSPSTQQPTPQPPVSSLAARNMTIAALRASMAAVAGERLDVAVTCFPKGSPGLFPPGVAAALDEEEFNDTRYSLLRRAMLQTLGMQVDYPLLMPPDLLGLLIEDF
ncbi:hypothetical protein HDU86_005885 [Geranomyces michiganensis]|nr:hypothetical protein HDU86_005885 [Geranomyces michiganensis]